MQNYNLSALKVLIVEDSSFMVQLYRFMLSAFQIKTIEHVGTLSDFTQKIEKFQPDLILTDWEMEGFDGEEIMRLVRHNPNPRITFTPTFAISSFTEAKKIESMLKSGVDDLIAKPVSAADLYNRIARFLLSPPQYVRGPDYFGPERNLKRLEREKVIDAATMEEENDVVWL